MVYQSLNSLVYNFLANSLGNVPCPFQNGQFANFGKSTLLEYVSWIQSNPRHCRRRKLMQRRRRNLQQRNNQLNPRSLNDHLE
jgi:hypothetical protein